MQTCPRVGLVSAFCSCPPSFALGFLHPRPHGRKLALGYLVPPNRPIGDLHSRPNVMSHVHDERGRSAALSKIRINERGKSTALKMKTLRSYSEVPRWKSEITRDVTSLPRTLGIEKRNRLCALCRFSFYLEQSGNHMKGKTERDGMLRGNKRPTHRQIFCANTERPPSHVASKSFQNHTVSIDASYPTAPHPLRTNQP